MTALRLLMVEDSEDDVLLLIRALAKSGIEVVPRRVDTAAALVAALASDSFDAVICDYVLPQLDAARVLSLVRERVGPLPCIVLSGQLTPGAKAAAAHGGAIACLEKDDVAGVVAALRRFVERQETGELHLKNEEASFEANELTRFFGLSLDCLCIASLDGYFKRVNAAFERTVGAAAGVLLDRPFLEFVHPDDRQATEAVMKQLRIGRARVGFENRYRHSDGTYRWLEWTAHPVVEKGLVYAVARDVTERKELEDALRRSVEEIRDLYDRAPCGYHSLDTDGVFVEVNETELGWLGYSRDEIVGVKRFADLLGPESLIRFWESFPRFKQEGSVGNLEFSLRRKDGSQFPVLLNATVIHDEQGRYLKSRSTVFDMTVRKEEERRLNELNDALVRRTAELEAMNHELEAFSYSASHDLRAPLRAIDGFTSMLIEDWPPDDLNTAFAHIERVRIAVRKMRALIDDLLKLSQFGRSALRIERVDLSAIAEEVVAGLRVCEPERLVEVEIAPNVIAAGDPKSLRVVFENLLENAWKFTRRTDAARLEFGTCDEPGGKVYFVRDNGAGFDDAFVGKLFTAFQRLHMASEFEGTGIGLAIVRRVVLLHGGRVWAEGAVGQGATFYFTLAAQG